MEKRSGVQKPNEHLSAEAAKADCKQSNQESENAGTGELTDEQLQFAAMLGRVIARRWAQETKPDPLTTNL